MTETEFADVAKWIVRKGIVGLPEEKLLEGLCVACCRGGMNLSRAVVVIDTLHPVFEGRAFRWRGDGIEENAVVDYGSTQEGEAAASWQRSVFHHLLTTGGEDYRCRLESDTAGADPFPQLKTWRDEGLTDYLALIQRFSDTGTIGDMDCIYMHWLSDRPGGFGDADVEGLKRLAPTLALAVKCGATARIAGTLAEVYLGRDAGQRVLSGRITRGVADRIGATLWFSDLRGYTTISDTAPPDEIIPLLNDYTEAVIEAVHAAGGDVLKLIGDGVLAIFAGAKPDETCGSALAAEAGLRRRLAALNARRNAEGRPVTSVYLGLHVGEVFYGNIGSPERLDFTVVGPAVNQVSRIASMCRSADRHMLVSSDFRAALLPEASAGLVCVGRYALRGFDRAEELFTLDPQTL